MGRIACTIFGTTSTMVLCSAVMEIRSRIASSIVSRVRGFGWFPVSSMIHNIGAPVYIYAAFAYVPAVVTQFGISEVAIHLTKSASDKIEKRSVEGHGGVMKAQEHEKTLSTRKNNPGCQQDGETLRHPRAEADGSRCS